MAIEGLLAHFLVTSIEQSAPMSPANDDRTRIISLLGMRQQERMQCEQALGFYDK